MKNLDFYSAVQNRRSIYGINNEQVISDEELKEVINFAVKHSPTAFNSQSDRVVVLLGESHLKLWEITKETLRKIIPSESFTSTEEKMKSFANGYGTVLFFEDTQVIKNLQDKFELYKDNFPIWSQQGNGMLQFIVWTALDLEGYGASLQHYNPLIDDEVKNIWNIPNSWKLTGQMPFGKKTLLASEKQFNSLEERIKFYE